MTPTKTRKQTGEPVVTLTSDDLLTISKLVRRNVTDYESLMASLVLLNTVMVDGIPVRLEARLLQRLKSRCLDKERFPQWLSELVVRQLHDAVGW